MAVTYTAGGPVGTITLDNPPANSYDIEFMRELAGAIGEANRSEARVVVLRSASEKFFSAGADVKRFLANDVDANMDMIRLAHEALASIARSEKLFVAFIAGHALGGGLEMALACDLRVAKDGILLGMPPAKLGLVYSHTGLRRFIDAIGVARTRELFLLGRNIDADTALSWGLVNRVAEGEQLEHVSIELAGELAGNAPLSQVGNKRVIAALLSAHGELDEGTEQELIELRRASFASLDMREGVQAFAERRAPRWRGE